MVYCIYVTDPNLLTNPDHVANYNRVGALISVSKNSISAIPGTAVKQVAQLNRKYKWDESTQDIYDTRADRFVTTEVFFSRFTQDEIEVYMDTAQLNGTRNKLDHYATNNRKLDLDSDYVSDIMDDFETRGVITAQRRIEILA